MYVYLHHNSRVSNVNDINATYCSLGFNNFWYSLSVKNSNSTTLAYLKSEAAQNNGNNQARSYIISPYISRLSSF